MWQIPVFKAEREAGLEEQIRSSARLSYAALAEIAPAGLLSERAKARLATIDRAKATNADQFDLFYLKTLLVSTGWNLNDDVFDRQEVWAARATPEDKQFNYEHNCADIIGHITDCQAIDIDGEALAADLTVDALPDKFHIVTNAVLYRVLADQKLQERMDTIIAEIGEGKWYVSMEALFRGFDYGIVHADNTSEVVARNEKTAFLTKHLRAYGGNGTFKDMKVGRLMKSITFSGKGLVRKPANPESIIFSTASTTPFVATTEKLSHQFLETGYGELRDQPSQTKEEHKAMASEIEILQKQLADAKAANEQLQAQLRDSDVKSIKAKLEAAEATVKAEQEARVKAEADSKGYQDGIASLTAAALEADKALKAAQTELETIKAEQKKTNRISAVKTKLNKNDEQATKYVELFASLTDEQFAANVEHLEAEAVKSTPAPLAPKATPAPVAMTPATKVATVPAPGVEVASPIAPTNIQASETPVETDPAEENANASVIANATPAKDAALATQNTESTDTGVETTRAAIADYFTTLRDGSKAKTK